ncbi:endoglucanase 3 [Sarracenia purpurea var. burkii]
MASGHQNQEGEVENLRKQLAVAVRSIQWSYAIFWSISSAEPGMLEWGDGYYNGDIKTRKTIQAVEFNADQLGLQRSEQLRELYGSLSAGESSPQARRPSAALSPEDLTDTEWYYLTVVCFPFLGGVIELGVTELILEDPSLIQQIKTSFLGFPHPIVSTISNSVSGNTRNSKDLVQAKLDQEILDTHLNYVAGCEELLQVYSPNNSSNRYGNNPHVEESFMVEGLNEGASQVQSWQLMDDELSNCVHNSVSSSDCISQTLVNPKKIIIPVAKGGKENDGCLLDIQPHNQMNLTSLGLQADDIHYQSVISTLLKSSHQLVLGPHFGNFNQESSFISWKKGDFMGIQIPRIRTPQRLLKKALFEVAQMHGGSLPDYSREDNGIRDAVLWRPQVDDVDSNHVLAERRRREKINRRFSVLGSLIPSTSKVDKVSILDNTIEYLKELGRRVEELDSCREAEEIDIRRTRRKPHVFAERTSENHGSNKKKPSTINKRKACEFDEVGTGSSRVLLKESKTDEVSVSMIEKDVLIEITCPWREFLLLEIMDSISQLQLDSHSVQSTNIDGILSLTIKSKLKGSTVASAGIIRQELQRVVQKY